MSKSKPVKILDRWFRRLAPAELELRNISRKARNYIEVGADGLDRVATISARQFEELRNAAEFGEPLSKEERTRRLRGKGTTPKTRLPGSLYRTPRARKQASYAARARSIRAAVPGIAPRDAKLLDRKTRGEWSQFTSDEKDDFAALFDRYPRDEVLAALGSPPTK